MRFGRLGEARHVAARRGEAPLVNQRAAFGPPPTEEITMTEDDVEVVVTPEMVRAGYEAYAEATRWHGLGGLDEYEGLEAAFPAMLRVWMVQGGLAIHGQGRS